MAIYERANQRAPQNIRPITLRRKGLKALCHRTQERDLTCHSNTARNDKALRGSAYQFKTSVTDYDMNQFL